MIIHQIMFWFNAIKVMAFGTLFFFLWYRKIAKWESYTSADRLTEKGVVSRTKKVYILRKTVEKIWMYCWIISADIFTKWSKLSPIRAFEILLIEYHSLKYFLLADLTWKHLTYWKWLVLMHKYLHKYMQISSK